MDAPALSVLVAGFVLGMHHALDPDHVVAVSTLVAQGQRLARSILVGMWWGVGHTLTLLLAGLPLLFLRVQLPRGLALSFELGVGVLLMGLGMATILRYARKRVHVHVHQHDGGVPHLHVHAHPAGRRQPDDHRHTHRVEMRRPLLIGMAHGLAGSGALALLVLGSTSSYALGLFYIALFGLGSMVGMGGVALLLALPFALAAQSATAQRLLGVAAGMASFAVGLLLVWEVGYTGLLAGLH